MVFAKITTGLWRQVAGSASLQQKRHLHLSDYQSHKLLKEIGITVPRGQIAGTPTDVGHIISQFGSPCLVETQGGSARAQAVKIAAAGQELASEMLSRQTGATNTIVKAVTRFYVTEEIQFSDSMYLAMALDRESRTPVVIASRKGQPVERRSFKLGLDEGVTPDLVSDIAEWTTASAEEKKSLKDLLDRLHRLFITKEATALEISQLAVGSDGAFTALRADLVFDDAAQKRQPELFALRDVELQVAEELEAEKYGLVYIKMDGDIGNVVNGAGLAMATNDAIALAGGRSLNFLDAGGQATKQTMQKAFEIILRDAHVKVILVNIYGGIIKCDMIADSIIGAAQELGPLRVPLVVRLQGTNSPEGLKILQDANLGFHVESDFGKAAETAVRLSKAAK